MTTATQTPTTADAAAQAADRLELIPLEDVLESPRNPRQTYNETALAQLAAHMAKVGQLTPVLVRPHPTQAGKYELGAGHRRKLAATRALEQDCTSAVLAGLDHLKAIVRDMDDRTFLELLTVENLQREDLTPIEEAGGFQTMLSELGYSIQQLAERVGKSTRYVYDSLTLLKLSTEGQQVLREGKVTRAHAVELARLTPAQQRELIGSNLSGLWQVDHAGPERVRFDHRGYGRKAVSVRELKQHIDRHIRFKPAEADLLLFEDTVDKLTVAEAGAVEVVEITYLRQVPDSVKKDQGARIHTAQSWRSATPGILSPSYPETDGKPCEYAVLGVVVCGERRGQAFEVCTAKEQCKTHWQVWQRERKQRREAREAQKRIEAGDTRELTPAQKAALTREQNERAERQRADMERARWTKARPQLQKALLEAIASGKNVNGRSAIAQLVAEEVVGHGKRPKPTKLEDLVRQLAAYVVQERLADTWENVKAWGELAKRFGVNATAIVDELTPPASTTSTRLDRRACRRD